MIIRAIHDKARLRVEAFWEVLFFYECKRNNFGSW